MTDAEQEARQALILLAQVIVQTANTHQESAQLKAIKDVTLKQLSTAVGIEELLAMQQQQTPQDTQQDFQQTQQELWRRSAERQELYHDQIQKIFAAAMDKLHGLHGNAASAVPGNTGKQE